MFYKKPRIRHVNFIICKTFKTLSIDTTLLCRYRYAFVGFSTYASQKNETYVIRTIDKTINYVFLINLMTGVIRSGRSDRPLHQTTGPTG